MSLCSDVGQRRVMEGGAHRLKGRRVRVSVNIGRPEAAPDQVIYLVSFETGPERELGLPFGCLPEEITQEPT